MDKDRSRIWEKYLQRRSATSSDSDTESDPTETSTDSTSPEAENDTVTKMDPDALRMLTELMQHIRASQDEITNIARRQQEQQQQFMEHMANRPQQQPQQPPPQAAAPGGAQGAQALPEPKLTANTYPELNLDGANEATKINNFAAWERGVRNTTTALDAEARMPFQRIAAAILSSFRGTTALQAIDLAGDQFANMNGLMNTLRTLFCGAATQERSYNLFIEASQRADEDLTTWWSRLQNLWNRGFNEPRPVNTLIRAFVDNLADKKVQEKLITREAGIPNDYQELKQIALEIAGREDTLRIVRKARGQGHRIPVVDRGTPMEIGAVAKGKRGDGKVAVNNANPGPGRRRVEPDQCLKCHKKGHWKKDCPDKDKGKNGKDKKKVFLVTGGGNDEPADQHVYQPEDSDDDDDWATVAATEAGNGQAQAQSHQA